MESIRTIIFDMDGVIIDSEPIHMKIERKIFRELGLNITEKEHQKFVGTSSLEMWTAITIKNNLDISANQLSKKARQQYLNYLRSADNIHPIDGIKEIINHLHKSEKKMIVASSSTRQEIEYVLTKLQLKSYFSFIVSGAELKRSKPDPKIFLVAAALSQTSPVNCCVIEDSKNGVEAAKAAGMRCIGFRNPNSGNQDISKSDVILDNLKNAEIDKILNDISN